MFTAVAHQRLLCTPCTLYNTLPGPRSVLPAHTQLPRHSSHVLILSLWRSSLQSSFLPYPATSKYSSGIGCRYGRNQLSSVVCSLWQSIALSTPQLWQRISVHQSVPVSGVVARSKAKGLVLWIERAGSLPLTLFFYHDRMYESASGDPIVKVLNRYAPRFGVRSWTKPPLSGRFTRDHSLSS